LNFLPLTTEELFPTCPHAPSSDPVPFAQQHGSSSSGGLISLPLINELGVHVFVVVLDASLKMC